MYTDPVLDEIRAYREAYAAGFNYDVKAMVEDLRRREEASDRPAVSREPKRITDAEPETGSPTNDANPRTTSP